MHKALIEIEREGLVQCESTGRTRVRILTERDFAEIREARIALESMAARRAAALWPPKDSRFLEENIARQAQASTHRLQQNLAFEPRLITVNSHRHLLADLASGNTKTAAQKWPATSKTRWNGTRRKPPEQTFPPLMNPVSQTGEVQRPLRPLPLLRGFLGALLAGSALPAIAVESDPTLPKSYAGQAHPLFVKTCRKCHGETPKDNDLALEGLTSAESLFAIPTVLADVAGRLLNGDIPPRKAPQPTQAEREAPLNWVHSALDFTASAKSGDPDPVTLRRLTNNESDNAVRDLTASPAW